MSSKRKHLPVLLHLGKQLVLHVSETQTAEQGGQAGALGDALALHIEPGGVGDGYGQKEQPPVGLTPVPDTPPHVCMGKQTPFSEHAHRSHIQ